jgi:hypothetical protein
MNKVTRKVLIALAVAATAIAIWLMIDAPPSKADDGTDDPDTSQTLPGDNKTNEVCTAFNLGVPMSQLPDMLHANDGRENYWQGWKDSVWPIIEGQCDD